LADDGLAIEIRYLHTIQDSLVRELKIALSDWSRGIGDAIFESLGILGHAPVYFSSSDNIPLDACVVFTFGPYGRLCDVINTLETQFGEHHPLYVHWSTQGMPDPRIPMAFTAYASAFLFYLEKYGVVIHKNLINDKFARFRYVGLYQYAYKKGIMQILADTSAIYCSKYKALGIPAIRIPYGSSPSWGQSLNLDRDIDVLWMGKMGTRRRAKLIEDIQSQLRRRGRSMLICDNVRHPFIFGRERIEYLNRSKITLNLTRTWYDDNSLRFLLTAPNKSLVISEKLLPHSPDWISGKHYVAVSTEEIPEAIEYYLEHREERDSIVHNAYDLVSDQLTMLSSMKKLNSYVQDLLKNID
jgi:hypothetical protein